MARCLLEQGKLLNSFRVRAVDVAFYLTNRYLSCSLLPNKTPFELFYGIKPDLSNLNFSGCSAFRFLEVGVKKLDSKAVKEIFVGYGRIHDFPTLCIIQLLVRLVIRELCPLTKKSFLALEAVFQKTVSFFQNPRVLYMLKKRKSCFLSRWNRLLKMMIQALKKPHLFQSLQPKIQSLTFLRNSEHVAFAMLKLFSVMFVLLIYLITFHLLNVSRVKRSLTLWRNWKGHNREPNG